MFRSAASSSSRTLLSGLRVAARQPLAATSQFRAAAPIRVAQRLRPSISARWYSAEAETEKKDGTEAPKEGEAAAKEEGSQEGGGGVSEAEAKLRKDLDTKTKEASDWKDKCLRSVADFRNLQDRTTREMKTARDFAIQKFAKDLVDSIDNLDRALAMVPEEKLTAAEKTEHQQDLVNLYEGLKMTETVLMQTLKKHGLERFDPDGDKFNPNEHEATFMTPMKDKENNTVFHVQQKGFRLNGRVLRAAKVGVVKNN